MPAQGHPYVAVCGMVTLITSFWGGGEPHPDHTLRVISMLLARPEVGRRVTTSFTFSRGYSLLLLEPGNKSALGLGHWIVAP